LRPQRLSSWPSKQSLPWQQPDGQLLMSQMHWPALQRWPSTHAGPVPHRHTPAGEHPSATSAPHVPQAMPGAPHADAKWLVSQVLPAQQPFGHDA
jgi:hypothetical protein